MDSLQGRFLIAAPQLLDPNFIRTVVLVLAHNPGGALGVVLNRLHPKTVKDLWEQVSQGPCNIDRPLNAGGPVSGPVLALHRRSDHADAEVFPGLYYSAQREKLEQLLAEENQEVRVFLGHSGWAGGQLENELAQGAWLVLPASVEMIFGPVEGPALWQMLLFTAGRTALRQMLRPPHVAPNPSLN